MRAFWFVSLPFAWWFMVWAERNMCSDGKMEALTKLQFMTNVVVAGLGWWWYRHVPSRRPDVTWVFWLGIMAGTIINGLYAAACLWPHLAPGFHEHGVMEMTTPVFAMVAFVLYMVTASRGSRWFLLPGCLALLFALEEVSWGWIWASSVLPAEWFSGNLQGETNVHNFFNPLFPLIYELLGWIGLGLAVRAWMAPREVRMGWRVLLPGADIAGLLVLMFFFRFWQETFEEMAALAMLLHAGVSRRRAGS